jgi:hypothetical protein
VYFYCRKHLHSHYLQGWEQQMHFAIGLHSVCYCCRPKNGSLGTIAFIVGANILTGGAFDGASMNPAVSFGPTSRTVSAVLCGVISVTAELHRRPFQPLHLRSRTDMVRGNLVLVLNPIVSVVPQSRREYIQYWGRSLLHQNAAFYCK